MLPSSHLSPLLWESVVFCSPAVPYPQTAHTQYIQLYVAPYGLNYGQIRIACNTKIVNQRETYSGLFSLPESPEKKKRRLSLARIGKSRNIL
jgi:hypothetical protein